MSNTYKIYDSSKFLKIGYVKDLNTVTSYNPFNEKKKRWQFWKKVGGKFKAVNNTKITYNAAMIPIADLTHMLLVGSSGYGKTESLKLIAEECTVKDFGYVMVDPHGGLARDAVAILRSQGKTNDDYIYIAPRLAKEYESVVKINPLDIDPEMVNVFVDQLKHIYASSWGERLEAILRNSLLALMSLGREYQNLDSLRRFIVDDAFRESILPKIVDKGLRSFFQDVYPNYARDASAAAYNKLDRLLANPLVRAVFDTSSIPIDGGEIKLVDFGEAIRQKKKIIVDLSSIDEGSAAFVGGIILMMIFSAVRRMADRIENKANPYFVLLDEAQYFAPVLRELLNMFRKFNVKIIMATQTLSEKQIPFASEIIELTSTICCFRAGRETVRPIRDLLTMGRIRNPEEDMPKLEPYTFVVYSRGNPPTKGILRTKVRTLMAEYNTSTAEGKRNVITIIRENILKNGTQIAKDLFISTQREIEVKLGFTDYATLSTLFKNGNAMTRNELYSKMLMEYEITNSDARESLYRLLSSYYIQMNGEDIVITPIAIAEFFSYDINSSNRVGSDRHVDVIMRIAFAYREQSFYPIIDDGKTMKPKADVTIIPFKRTQKDKKTVEFEWDYDNIFVFEVETNPGAHEEQVYKNFTKSFKKGFRVNFAVFSESDRGVIYNIMKNNNVPTEQFRVWLIDELPKPSEYFGKGQTPIQSKPSTEKDALIKRVKNNYKDTDAIDQLTNAGYTITIDEQDSIVKIRIRNTNTGDDHKYTVKKDNNP